MAGPNPLLLFFLYQTYRKNFLNDPNNIGKKPKGCFVWSFLSLLKFAVVCFTIIMVLYLIIWLTEMLSI